MENMPKSYFAVIPANVRYDKKLKLLSRMLYGEITALCNDKGYCWATNRYFSELYQVTPKTISSAVSQLKEAGYINVRIIQKQDSKEIEARLISLCNVMPKIPSDTYGEKNPPLWQKKSIPMDEKVHENNTLEYHKELNKFNSNMDPKNEIEEKPKMNKRTAQKLNTLKDKVLHNPLGTPKKETYKRTLKKCIGEFTENKLMQKVLKEYVDMRGEKKNRPTVIQFEKMLDNLRIMANGDTARAIQIVEHCTRKGWFDFYDIHAPKEKSKFDAAGQVKSSSSVSDLSSEEKEKFYNEELAKDEFGNLLQF